MPATKTAKKTVRRNGATKKASRMTPSRDVTLNEVEKQFAQLLQTQNDIMTVRREWMKDLFDPRRDLNAECGYPDVVNIAEYQYMYDREGLGTRVVNLLPEECWKQDPLVNENEDPSETEFERAWKAIENEQNIYAYLQRLDRISGIGHFGVMFISVNDGKQLHEPIAGFENDEPAEPGNQELQVQFLRVFPQTLVRISEFENNPMRKRYGLPLSYNIKFNDPRARADGSSAPLDVTERKVHWSRVIHVADNRVASEVFGTPRMQHVWNRLYDVRKIMGGSAEMFWKGGFPGLSFELQPGLTDVEIDKEALRKEIQRYADGLQRYLAVEGLTTKSLAPQLADPEGHVMAQVKMVAIAMGVPLRILMGSEAAHLASTQDAVAWNTRLQYRREKYITPWVLKPLIDRFVLYGILPSVDEYSIVWPDLNQPSEEDKAKVAEMWTKAVALYIQSGADVLVHPLDYLTMVLGVPEDQAESVLEAAMQRIEVEDDFAVKRQRAAGEAAAELESDTDGPDTDDDATDEVQ